LIVSARRSLILEGIKNEKEIKSAVIELYARFEDKYFSRGRV